MTPTSLIIVADRGEIKAYRVKKTPNRGANLQLVQALDLTDAHGRYGDKLTDQAGRFPVSDGNGRHANSIAERTALEHADAVIAVSNGTRADIMRVLELCEKKKGGEEEGAGSRFVGLHAGSVNRRGVLNK